MEVIEGDEDEEELEKLFLLELGGLLEQDEMDEDKQEKLELLHEEQLIDRELEESL